MFEFYTANWAGVCIPVKVLQVNMGGCCLQGDALFRLIKIQADEDALQTQREPLPQTFACFGHLRTWPLFK